MASTDNYRLVQSQEKIELFSEIFALKNKKADIEKRIKELEKQWKPEIEKMKIMDETLRFQLPNGIKFSISKTKRKGSVDTTLMEYDGIDVEKYRKPESEVITLRKEK